MVAVFIRTWYDTCKTDGPVLGKEDGRPGRKKGRQVQMIAFLKGEVADLTENSVVLEINGIGYEVLVPGQVLSMLNGTGRTVKLYTYMQVREDAVVLFGFLSKDDLQMFRMLTGVSGVGPKAGLNVLSSLGTDDLRFAVLSDDAKRIAKTPGIGAKTAQKIILELKDKLDLEDVFEKKFSSGQELPETVSVAGKRAAEDAVQALVALGYGSTEALKAVRLVNPADDMDVEEILKEALKRMAF